MPKHGVVWVIGGTSGIGEAAAEWLLDEGANVHVTGEDRDVRSIPTLHDELTRIESSSAGLAGVVYSAGTNHLEWLGQTAHPHHRDPIDVNLVGFINVLEVLARGELRHERPLSVVAVSSDAARRPMRTSIGYCASKAGLDMAVKVAARELGPFGWRVNAVSPGMTGETGMQAYVDKTVPLVRNWTEERTRKYEAEQEVISGRVHKNEVAEIIGHTLFGPEHLNGAIIEINGGR